MEDRIYKKVINLKEKLIESDEYKRLKQKEKEMESDHTFIEYCRKKELILSEYEDSLKIYSKSSKELLKIKCELADILKKINELPVVIEYERANIEFQRYIDLINNEIFDLIK